MGYFAEIDIELNCGVEDYSYPSPELQLQWRIEELKDWLRWYGCEFVDNEDFLVNMQWLHS